jgi:hypothetical protein
MSENNTMKTVNYFVHFHKNFPHINDSAWVMPTIFENKKGLIDNAICLSKFSPSIRSLFNEFEPMDEDRIGYLSQTIATEYWILNHLTDVDYVGVTGYRRFPHFRHDRTNSNEGFVAPASQENLSILTHDSHLVLINEILNTYDAITIRKIHCGGSVKSQFLDTQREDIWNHFIDSIATVVPEYKRWLGWFELENQCHFCGPMGLTPLPMFKEYSDMYIRIIADILRWVENPFLCLDQNAEAKTDRWIGYLAERFYPFFLFVNNVKTYQVPMILLTEPT